MVRGEQSVQLNNGYDHRHTVATTIFNKEPCVERRTRIEIIINPQEMAVITLFRGGAKMMMCRTYTEHPISSSLLQRLGCFLRIASNFIIDITIKEVSRINCMNYSVFLS